ncbi:flagellar synthesis: repressor of fliC [Salmonella enterica subsp. enterica serovar Typhi]|uniref:Transcriptional regulator n=1 Tax=Salmonella enterica subsp. enterica serovar Typhi str. CT18 TaxID=220341 RepID=A0A716H8B1_SALTI|nr:transcriptional regulator [Salmonella enterica]CRJ41669.1 flagellar synthesis: repressor of fliC [Salmonella enterica subsp. enterica serovar Typhi]HAD4280057.1 transcriptional regulator [Salmonella enterica subsp. enterica serovar Typhi str. CT18]EJI2790055.1 transcriptional regulator [Salmonella enterica]HAD5225274.1 transcriptional regulator [Salmonella enterica subsp. enterica serovar Typhi str. CT18]
MTITDITYGIPAEVWPRDYSKVEFSLQYDRANNVPVKVTLEDGQVFCLYVNGLLTARNKLDLSPVIGSKEHRVRLPLERVSTIETIIPPDVDKEFTGRLTISNEDEVNQPSKRDFFKICRQAYNAGKSIRVYMADGREIEGVSLGVDACQVTMIVGEQTRMIVFFDWVERILPF